MSDDPPGRTCSWKPVTDAVKAILSMPPSNQKGHFKISTSSQNRSSRLSLFCD